MADEPVDSWDETRRELGYINCRPCREWHRPPECAIDMEGFSLMSCGCRWSDDWAHRNECPLSEPAEREDDYDEPDCAFGTALAVMPEPMDGES